ncbi:MAG: hypothetical protein ABSB26_00440 [Nitrososphaerales archaeon]
MNPKRIYKIAGVLVKSQLRSGRSSSLGMRFFNSPKVILLIDAIVFVVAAGLVYGVLGLMGVMSEETISLLNTITLQALTSLPALIPPIIFIAAVLFELSVSSKFASSDVVNWLPVSQTDYVSASTLSVSFMYSFIVALGLGVTFPLAVRASLLPAWAVSAVLSFVVLFATGALVEIMRAALNRVTSAVYGKAGRGTVVIRVVVTVLVIMAVELGFNPVILSNVVGTFSGVVSSALLVPFFWSSVAVSYLIAGQPLQSAAFSALTVLFALFVLLAAVRVRAKYWSPLPVTIEVTESEYYPRAGFLQSLGLSAVEAAIVRKDLKGFTRRRELLPYIAIPVVFVALIVVQQLTTPGSNSGPGGATVYPFWLIGGIMTILVATTSVGQEGKAILNIYAFPISPRVFLRAKLLVASLFGMVTILAMLVVSSVLASTSVTGFAASLLVSIVIVGECVFIGLGVATRFPDLQERPRPRFVQPGAMILAMLLGVLLALVTAFPLVLWPFMSGYLEGLGLSYGIAVGLGLAFGCVVCVIAYRWAKSGAAKLLNELIV